MFNAFPQNVANMLFEYYKHFSNMCCLFNRFAYSARNLVVGFLGCVIDWLLLSLQLGTFWLLLGVILNLSCDIVEQRWDTLGPT